MSLAIALGTVNWESSTKENVHDFRRIWNACECFLATILYLIIILTKNMHC